MLDFLLVIFMVSVMMVCFWSFYGICNSEHAGHDNSMIPFKLSPPWKKALMLGNPDRELYNIFIVIGTIIAYILVFCLILYYALLFRFIEFSNLLDFFFGWLKISLIIMFVMTGIPLIFDGHICSIIKKKRENVVLNRFSRWMLVDKEGVQDITLFKTRFMSWQDIKVVGVGTVVAKKTKVNPCVYISANEMMNTNLSHHMISDELFIVSCRKDIVDIILDFMPDEITTDLTAMWYRETFPIQKETYGKRPIRRVGKYFGMGEYNLNRGNYVKAMEWHRKGLAIMEAVFGRETRDSAVACGYIAHIYWCQQLYFKSLEWYVKSYRWLNKKSGEMQPVSILIKKNMEEVYSRAGISGAFDEWLTKRICEGGSSQESDEKSSIPDSFIVYKAKSEACFMLGAAIFFGIFGIGIIGNAYGEDFVAGLVLGGMFSVISIILIIFCIYYIRRKIKVVKDTIYATPFIGRVKVVDFTELDHIEFSQKGLIVYANASKIFKLDGSCVNYELLYLKLESR